MAEIVSMPKLGFDMAEGTLIRWVVGEGEEVKKGAVLAEIETDKATVEVESSHEGTVRRHLVKEGDIVPVGDPIAVVGTPDENIDNLTPSKEAIKEAGEAAPGAFPTKDMAEGGEGTPEARLAYVGEVKEKGAEEGTSPAQAAAQAKEAEQPQQPAPEAGQAGPGPVTASPVARRMADENNIDLRNLKGTGPDGRIVKKDIETYLAQPRKEEAPAPAAQGAPAAAPAAQPSKAAIPLVSFAPAGPPPPDETIPVSRLRGAVGRRMVQSKTQAPHFYVTHEYNMAPLMDLRKQINAMLPEDQKVSVNDLIVKAVALTLRQFPNVNASLDGDKIILHGAVNIGIAVALEGGLMTVVVRDADRKPVRQIGQEAREMAARVRSGKIKAEDVEGSTFSTSNLGMFDVEHFIAILNPPEAGILAIGSAREVPVVENGELKVGSRMKATISVDHRVSDGAEAARFMQALAQFIEQPLSLML
jgi:pyruvate dehydrogenase E2 component (dihydrolipoamide acetyltransferase)